jgi:hypothetical protein
MYMNFGGVLEKLITLKSNNERVSNLYLTYEHFYVIIIVHFQVGILEQLNIVFLSDHGGQAVPVPSQYINLDNYINRTWYIRDGVPPNLQIYPLPG